jgi:hypothetical protein
MIIGLHAKSNPASLSPTCVALDYALGHSTGQFDSFGPLKFGSTPQFGTNFAYPGVLRKNNTDD